MIHYCKTANFDYIGCFDLFPDLIGDRTCGLRVAPGVQSRIVGGTDAALGDWPWIGSLQFSGSQSCGATLIKPNVAISAAHCLYVHL